MSASRTPTFEIDAERIGWITFDDPDRSMNVLTESVMMRLSEILDEAHTAAGINGLTALVVRSGKPDSFMAGADIDVIGSLENPQEAERVTRAGQSVYDKLAAINIPTVAAIHGVCMGGGVEMALACDRRLVSDSDKTKLGLPEVQLGILPAWGGTTRLPRLIGLQAALDMLLTGKRLDARRCKRVGLASEILPAELFEEATRDFVRALLVDREHGAPPKRPLRVRLLDETPPGRAIVLRTARKRVMKQTGGHYPAPLRILDILKEHLGGGVAQSLDAEAKAAAELLVSPVCNNLVHVFHMREAARKADGIGGSGDGAATPVAAMGVLGAGVMGGGVAQLAATRGVSVYMKDIDHGAVTGGLQHARSLFDKSVKRRRMSKREASQQLEKISGGLDYHGISGADVVVEAIVEKLEIKKAVLRETEAFVSSGCVLATNTSSLSVAAMAEALEKPERFCGMHFFNPVHRMPLVEVIRGPESSDRAVATVYRLAVRLGKVPVVVGDGPGFLVNRILGLYLNEAGFLLEDVGSVEAIDRVAVDFGMPMGPLRLVDEVGIDVSGHAGESLHRGLGERLTPSPLLQAIGETGRLGKKGGLGFYRYDGDKEQGVDEGVYTVLGLPAPSGKGGGEDEAIRSRLVLTMINEAARILEDGIVRSAADVDLGMIMGTGFPPFRGGLLRFADTLHPRGILGQLSALHDKLGPRFEPAPVLVRLAAEDSTFYEAFPAPTVE